LKTSAKLCEVALGDGCWIAAGAFIGPGAVVPAGTMVKAGEVWKNAVELVAIGVRSEGEEI
jgi:acetyltransferase-like isoleucine patch superfamily enzyme